MPAPRANIGACRVQCQMMRLSTEKQTTIPWFLLACIGTITCCHGFTEVYLAFQEEEIISLGYIVGIQVDISES